MTVKRSFFILILLLFSTALFAEETLFGAAESVRFKRSQFIGGLYAANEIDRDKLYAGNADATMVLLVTAKRLSHREFTNSWLEGMAVNNDQATLDKNKLDILRFTSAFKGALYNGDIIRISRRGDEVQVTLNDVNLLTTNSKHLFGMLLSTWVGPVPLSTPFKNGIGGEIANPAIVDSLKVATVNPERKTEVESWFEADNEQQTLASNGHGEKPAAEVAEKKSPSANSQKIAKVEPVVAKPVAVEKKPVKSEPKAKVADKSEQSSESSKKAAVAVAEAKVDQKAKAVVSGEDSGKKAADKVATSAAKPVEQPKAKPLPIEKPEQVVASMAPVAVPAAKSRSVEPSEEQLAEQFMVRQNYYNELRSAINVYKHLPQQAIMRRISGEVRVLVQIDSKGKLLNTDLVDASKYDIFNKQAIEAVTKAAPFDPVPAELDGDTFEFEVLLVYPPYF